MSPARPEEHDGLNILMLNDHVRNLSQTPQYSEFEYTPVVREEIRLVKIVDTRDIQLKDEMDSPMKVQWHRQITKEATKKRER